ncbi:MAG: PD40 domain-containing protein [Ignavibacteriales bacterium]|nr:PD40 domain-containing protein [Ignavibacteriales bacterium]
MPLFVLSVLFSLVNHSLEAQPRVVATEELALGTDRSWQNPRFSPTGTSIFYTSENFHGIWEYSLESKTIRQVTSDPHSGFGYALSRDGKSIAYRSTTILPSRRRKQEIIVVEIGKPEKQVVDSGENLSNPSFANNKLLYSKGSWKEVNLHVQSDEIQILGIENTKIALLKDSRRVLLDPFGSGSYIWPSLSPDKKFIVAYEVDRGTFVSDLDGTLVARLGRRDAPSWTHDGKWIAFMNEQDDGHQILASDILLISPDGKEVHQLTETMDAIELNPQCSPTEKKIVYNTLDGRIFVLTYTE